MNYIFHLIITFVLFLQVSSLTFSFFEDDETTIKKTLVQIKLNKTEFYKSVVRDGASDDPEKQLELLVLAEVLIRLSYVEDIIDYGFLPHLVKYLDSKNATIQYEAALSLAYLAINSSKTAEKIAEYDAIPKFYKLLHSTENQLLPKLSLDFLYAVVPFQNHYNEMELVKEIQKLLYSNSSNEKLMEDASFIFVKLCSCETFSPQKETIEQLLPTLFDLLQHPNDKVREGIAETFVTLAVGAEDYYQCNFDKEDIIKDFIELLDDEDENVQSAALTVLADLIDEENEKCMISSGILKNISEFLSSSNEKLVRSAVLTVAFLSERNLEAIFQYPDIIPSIFKHLSTFDETNFVRAMIFVLNILFTDSDANVLLLFNTNVVGELCEILKKDENDDRSDSELVLYTYYYMILKYGHQKCFIFDQLEKCDGIQKLYELVFFENDKPKETLGEVLDLYYKDKEEGTCQDSFM